MQTMLDAESIAVPLSVSEVDASVDASDSATCHVPSQTDIFEQILGHSIFYATNGQLDLSPSFLTNLRTSILPEIMRRFPILERQTGSTYIAPFHSYECFLMCLHEADRKMPLALLRRPLHKKK